MVVPIFIPHYLLSINHRELLTFLIHCGLLHMGLCSGNWGGWWYHKNAGHVLVVSSIHLHKAASKVRLVVMSGRGCARARIKIIGIALSHCRLCIIWLTSHSALLSLLLAALFLLVSPEVFCLFRIYYGFVERGRPVSGVSAS